MRSQCDNSYTTWINKCSSSEALGERELCHLYDRCSITRGHLFGWRRYTRFTLLISTYIRLSDIPNAPHSGMISTETQNSRECDV